LKEKTKKNGGGVGHSGIHMEWSLSGAEHGAGSVRLELCASLSCYSHPPRVSRFRPRSFRIGAVISLSYAAILVILTVSFVILFGLPFFSSFCTGPAAAARSSLVCFPEVC
jgi:hypothetical protein